MLKPRGHAWRGGRRTEDDGAYGRPSRRLYVLRVLILIVAVALCAFFWAVAFRYLLRAFA